MGELFLLGFKLEGGALGAETFAQTLACVVAPIGVELSLLFKHWCSRYEGENRECTGWTHVDTVPKGTAHSIYAVLGCRGH